MATRTVTTMIDDLTEVEGEDVQPREFSIDGKTYTADFSDETWNEFLEDVSRYVEVATVVKPGKDKSKPSKGKSDGAPGRMSREHSKAIREWANANGFEVSERGRIPNEIVEKFNAAH